jgi:hypothetical protein
MSVFLEVDYLKWLYSRIGDVEEIRNSNTYWELLTQLHNTEFIWLVANDDNRVEDGKYLRYSYLEDIDVRDDDVDQRWLLSGCSVLEMLISLANRMVFEAEFTVQKWFWEMLNNIGLSGFVDRRYDAEKVDTIVQRLIWRKYAPNGNGGLFPLRNPQRDQTGIELWYQCQEYLQERH